MTLESTRELVAAAAAARSAVPAFNVITLEYAEAIVLGAERAQTPVLLQLSENAVRYHGSLEPLLAACREIALAASVPVAIHLDHVEDASLIDRVLGVAEEFGVGSIMVDASRLEYEANVFATADVATRAHEQGLWVEAELGAIGGKDGAHAPGVRTIPSEACAFVSSTGVDGLAVAVGSSHAMRDRSASLDFDLIAELASTVSVPLVLHGSSGVADADIRLAVKAGIRKVNIGTALNLSWTGAVRAWLAEHPDDVDPRKYFSSAREATADVVTHLCEVVYAR
ncbi:MAG: class II fructose-bisphosphate aldolase [Lacisediminihabitans sp.]